MSEAHSTSSHTPRNELRGQARWVLGSCHCTFSFPCPIPSGQSRRLRFLLCQWAHHHPIPPPRPPQWSLGVCPRTIDLPFLCSTGSWTQLNPREHEALRDTVGTCSLLVTRCNSRDSSWIPRSASKPGLHLRLEPGQGGKQLVAALAASENREVASR